MWTHTHYISAEAFVGVCVSTIKAISAGQLCRSQIRAKVAVCMHRCRRVTCVLLPLRAPTFSIFRANLRKCVSLRVCVRLCVRGFMKEHRSLGQCGGLWQRKPIFVPLPPTGKGSYSHRTPLSSHTHT